MSKIHLIIIFIHYFIINNYLFINPFQLFIIFNHYFIDFILKLNFYRFIFKFKTHLFLIIMFIFIITFKLFISCQSFIDFFILLFLTIKPNFFILINISNFYFHLYFIINSNSTIDLIEFINSNQ